MSPARRKPPEPEVIGPATAIKRFFDEQGAPMTAAEIKALPEDERWKLAAECVAEMPGVRLAVRR